MDDLTRVRELTADTPPLTDEARTTAHTRLHGAIARETRGSRSAALPRRLVFRVALAGTATAAVAGGAVVVWRSADGEDAGAPRMIPLSAAQVLHRAADKSRSDRNPLPIPRNDQYLYAKTFITRSYLKGGKTKTWTDQSWMSVDGSKPSWRQEYGKVHHDPPLGKHEAQSIPTVYSQLQKVPKDPDKLLAMFTPTSTNDPKHTDLIAFFQICMLMEGPRVMPPGLQAALFEALAKLPRIRLDHHAADALGRPGVAVSYPGASFTFIFDRATYDYLGLQTKGSSPERVHGKWVQTHWYYEMRSMKEMGVVDRIGQHP